MSKKTILLIPLVIFFLLFLGLYLYLHKSLPTGKEGPEADALARAVEKATHKKAWDKTLALTWDFGGRYRHIWDRKRGYSQVSWGQKGKESRVQFRTGDKKGLTWHHGKLVKGPQKKKLFTHAYTRWINDTFWLNPLAKLFSPGAKRYIVEEGKQKHLLINYTKGGTTPGDWYMYYLDNHFLPTQWRLWVKVIPLSGVASSFEAWKTLPTGAKVSTKHKLIFMEISIRDLRGADSLNKLFKKDPFAELEKFLISKKSQETSLKKKLDPQPPRQKAPTTRPN